MSELVEIIRCPRCNEVTDGQACCCFTDAVHEAQEALDAKIEQWADLVLKHHLLDLEVAEVLGALRQRFSDLCARLTELEEK